MSSQIVSEDDALLTKGFGDAGSGHPGREFHFAGMPMFLGLGSRCDGLGDLTGRALTAILASSKEAANHLTAGKDRHRK